MARGVSAGPVLYELLCTECGSSTPAIASADGCVDLDEQLVCGHDPIKRDIMVIGARSAPVEDGLAGGQHGG